MAGNKINVTIRISHLGKSIKLNVDPSIDIKTIQERILSNQQLNLQRSDNEGNPYRYYMTSKRLGKVINGSFASSSIQEGDTIILNQEAIAG